MGENGNYKSGWHQFPLEPLETRWYTFENTGGEKGKGGMANHGRKGAPARPFGPGETVVLADIAGSGTIHRIWATLFYRTPEALRGIRLEIYWDGEEKPAVQAPFGDFFGHLMGHMAAFESECFSSPEGRSFVCHLPMPFKRKARVQLVNESGAANGIYYEVNCTLGERHDEQMLYFHSYWSRDRSTRVREDFRILPPVYGRGRFLGCHIGVRQNETTSNFWWGEGEVKVYLDGDAEFPTLCGTGTEDYIGTGYGQGDFSHRYQGNTFTSKQKDAYAFYRLHIPDPVYFHQDITVSIQVMGGPSFELMLQCMDKDPSLRFMKAGAGNEYFTRAELEADPAMAMVMEREADDYCAVAYWYMDAPAGVLPELAPVGERIAALPE